MGIDNIQLSKKERQILFSKNLVAIIQDENLKSVSKEIKINSLGRNEQHILFLVKDSQNKFLPDDEMDLLSNLVIACQLSLADIALVNVDSLHFNYQEIMEYFKPKKILMFGITTSELELPFSIPNFQVQQFQNQLYLTSPPLRDYLKNKKLKKELWLNLQKLFLLK